MQSNKKSAGFTLIELLLVVSLAAVSFGVMSVTLMTGFNIYQRLYDAAMNEEPAIFFEKISSDLRNRCDYSRIAFSPEEDGVTMATLLKEGALSAEAVLRPVEVSYVWDEKQGTLARFESDPVFSQISERTQVLVKNVVAFKLSFPQPNQATIFLALENSGKQREFTKKIFLPAQYVVSA